MTDDQYANMVKDMTTGLLVIGRRHSQDWEAISQACIHAVAFAIDPDKIDRKEARELFAEALDQVALVAEMAATGAKKPQ